MEQQIGQLKKEGADRIFSGERGGLPCGGDFHANGTQGRGGLAVGGNGLVQCCPLPPTIGRVAIASGRVTPARWPTERRRLRVSSVVRPHRSDVRFHTVTEIAIGIGAGPGVADLFRTVVAFSSTPAARSSRGLSMAGIDARRFW